MAPTSMQNLPVTGDRVEKISILLVTPSQADVARLRSLLPSRTWDIRWARAVREGAAKMRDGVAVVLTERILPDGTWSDLLAAGRGLSAPPPVIVLSSEADEFVWGEVLNLGGYDVLAKPFEASEVARVVHMGWRRWKGSSERVLLRKPLEYKPATATPTTIQPS